MQRVSDIKTPVQLYRHLCRRVRQLPVPVQDYYKHHIRQVRLIALSLQLLLPLDLLFKCRKQVSIGVSLLCV